MMRLLANADNIMYLQEGVYMQKDAGIFLNKKKGIPFARAFRQNLRAKTNVTAKK